MESAPNRKREPEKFFDTAGPPLIKESIELQKAKDAQRSQELVNQLQKKTGSVGGTQKGNVEGKKQHEPYQPKSLLEKQWGILHKQLEMAQVEYDTLSVFKKFGREGRFKRARLERINRQRDLLRQKMLPQRLRAGLADIHQEMQLRDNGPAELPDASFKQLDTAWDVYQAELAALDSLKMKRKSLSPWPWKDREQKQKLADQILAQETRVLQAKAEHVSDVRAQSLLRESKSAAQEEQHFNQ